MIHHIEEAPSMPLKFAYYKNTARRIKLFRKHIPSYQSVFFFYQINIEFVKDNRGIIRL